MSHFCQHCHHVHFEAYFCAEKRLAVDNLVHAYSSGKKLEEPTPLAELYPQYYKDVRHLDYIDVYRVHELWQVDDPSGCLQHADKKILLSGVRTGGKPKVKDIMEARDTLTRWLEMQAEDERA